MSQKRSVKNHSWFTLACQFAWPMLALLAPTIVFAVDGLPSEPVPEKLVVLTFDDSAKSHFSIVRPILMNYGFGATFFITEGFDFKENKRDYMTWDEIAQLHRDGFEIGNHTRDHLGITDGNVSQLSEQLKAVDDRCAEFGITKPISFSWPGNSLSAAALPLLKEHGIRFARRGGAPEYAYEKGKGFAFEPSLDHPLLLPSAGDARPDWDMADFVAAVEQARYGRIAILQFHGVPDTAHSWVNTPKEKFEQYMRYLAVQGYKVIALRDLANYVDESTLPQDPFGAIEVRKILLNAAVDYDNVRKPDSESELRFWLTNMLVDHKFHVSEVSAATGLTQKEIEGAIERLQISKPIELSKDRVRVLPYPGGRHPRIGFRDGSVRPQRETKLSVFLPWDPESYVVLDMPEAIWWMQEDRRELMYLAHTHIQTTWDKKDIQLEPTEWMQKATGWKMVRTLPNDVEFGVEAEPKERDVLLKMWVSNGSAEALTGLMVQNCVMLAHASGFHQSTIENKRIKKPFVACCDPSGKRWIITAWQACARPWANPPCPCMHSDPQFPDCPSGKRKELRGVLSFYEGDDLDAELERLAGVL